jgi:hypothetical protein
VLQPGRDLTAASKRWRCAGRRLAPSYRGLAKLPLLSPTYAHAIDPLWPLCPFEVAVRGAGFIQLTPLKDASSYMVVIHSASLHTGVAHAPLRTVCCLRLAQLFSERVPMFSYAQLDLMPRDEYTPLVPGACRDAGCAYQMRGDYALPPAAVLQDVYSLVQRSVAVSAVLCCAHMGLFIHNHFCRQVEAKSRVRTRLLASPQPQLVVLWWFIHLTGSLTGTWLPLLQGGRQAWQVSGGGESCRDGCAGPGGRALVPGAHPASRFRFRHRSRRQHPTCQVAPCGAVGAAAAGQRQLLPATHVRATSQVLSRSASATCSRAAWLHVKGHVAAC